MYSACHVDWTRPKGRTYIDDDLSLMCAMLSALYWKKYNGKIILFTDSDGYSFYSETGILDIWDEVNTSVLDNFSRNINPKTFWAAGKFPVIEYMKTPFFMMDLDFVLLDSIDKHPRFYPEKDMILFNTESLKVLYNLYVDSKYLSTPENYQFEEGFDWKLSPATCCFYYINNAELTELYTSEFYRFTENNKTENFYREMTFSEQRLLVMLLKKYKYNYSRLCNEFYHLADRMTLKNSENINYINDDFYFHLSTSNKKLYAEERKKIGSKMAGTLIKKFPEYKHIYTNIDILKGYFYANAR